MAEQIEAERGANSQLEKELRSQIASLEDRYHSSEDVISQLRGALDDERKKSSRSTEGINILNVIFSLFYSCNNAV